MKNFFDFIDFMKTNRDIKFFIAITPKLQYEIQLIENMINHIAKKTKNIEMFYTYDVHDPDLAILKKSMEEDAFVLSNDRFKQKIYDFFNRDKVIRFHIGNGGFKLIA